MFTLDTLSKSTNQKIPVAKLVNLRNNHINTNVTLVRSKRYTITYKNHNKTVLAFLIECFLNSSLHHYVYFFEEYFHAHI